MSTYSCILAITTANLQVQPVQPSAQQRSAWRNTSSSVPNVPTITAPRTGWCHNHQADPTPTSTTNPTITEQHVNNNQTLNLTPIPESESTRSGENYLLCLLLSVCNLLTFFKQILNQWLYLLAMKIHSQMPLVQLTLVWSFCIRIYLSLLSSLSLSSDTTLSSRQRTFSYSKPIILAKQ